MSHSASHAARCDASAASCSTTIRTARARTSGENLVGLGMAPSSQGEEPPESRGGLHEPRIRPLQSEAQHLYRERTNIFQRVGDGVAVVASGGRPTVESAATVATLINTPDAKTHDAVHRAVSRHAHNLVGAADRADVSGRRTRHDTASQVITARARSPPSDRVLSPI